MGFIKKYILFLATILSLVAAFGNVEDVDKSVNVDDDYFLKKFLENATLEKVNATCDCGWKNNGALEIVGGTETGINEFPAMAALINLNTGRIHCGSHIISDRYLLTAGHCVYQRPATTLAVLVGEHNIATGDDTPYSAIYYVNAYEIHPSYDPSTYTDDIAILQTLTKITFSNFVGPICLPFRYASASFTNQPVQILGWGQIEFSGPTSDVLLKATLQALSNAQCALDQSETITAGEICTYAYGKDSCQSDSGGPVLWTDTTTNRLHLVGIISHGVGCATLSPGINTRVTQYLNWIVSRTSDTSYCVM